MVVTRGSASAGDRTLPVGSTLAAVMTTLQRGTCVACAGHAPVAVALALTAAATTAGSWVVVAGLPTLGLVAAQAAGIPLERLVGVHHAHDAPFDTARWADLLAAMVDGFDLIVLGPQTHRVSTTVARRLQARAQAKGAVLMTAGPHPSFTPDVRVDSRVVRWHGLGHGHGLANSRTLEVTVHGRRAPRPRRIDVVLPGIHVPFAAPVATTLTTTLATTLTTTGSATASDTELVVPETRSA